ncbi:MAG: hypothetical protein KDI46_03295 [Alphaproteobacteria bacterium]|nr:hypothetical protein [Alphaproteobacteria bacterium]
MRDYDFLLMPLDKVFDHDYFREAFPRLSNYSGGNLTAVQNALRGDGYFYIGETLCVRDIDLTKTPKLGPRLKGLLLAVLNAKGFKPGEMYNADGKAARRFVLPREREHKLEQLTAAVERLKADDPEAPFGQKKVTLQCELCIDPEGIIAVGGIDAASLTPEFLRQVAQGPHFKEALIHLLLGFAAVASQQGKADQNNPGAPEPNK